MVDVPDEVLAAFGVERVEPEPLPPYTIRTRREPTALPPSTTKSNKRRRLRIYVYERDDFTCVNCGTRAEPPDGWAGEWYPGLTLGHIVPDCQGGTYSRANCVAQCEICQDVTGNKVWSAIGVDWTV